MDSKRPMTMKMASGEDESCVICFGEEGECDVYFSPCLHKACRICVTKLRVANVYKADKGVKCPICRQVIEGYLDAPALTRDTAPPWPEEKPFEEEKSPENLYGRKRITSIGNANDYVPPKGPTGGLKMNFRQDELHPGYVVPPLKPDADVLGMSMDKTGARHLDHMLREGYVKRHKVAKICRDILTPSATKLALHGSANFVLQRMLDYAAEHRAESGNSDCFFTAIVRSFCRENGIVSAGKDARGTFSTQKMLLLMQGTEEVKLVMKALNGSMVQLALHQFGVYVIQRLVEALITSVSCPAGQKPRVPPGEAVKCLAMVASELTGSPNDITKIGIHQVSGPMLVECIRWSLPEKQSIKAAMDVAGQSKQLIISRYGNRTLQGMFSLEVKEIADAIINCLEGSFAAITLDFFSWGWKLVRSCLATRCVDESGRMLIVDELIDSVDSSTPQMRVIDTQFGSDTLAFGLALSTRRCLDERLDRLEDWLTPLKFQRLKESVEQMRKPLFLESPAASQTTIDFTRRGGGGGDGDSNDPWADDDPASGGISKAVSEGSLSELSVEANSDWEQLAAGEDARVHSPPILREAPRPETPASLSASPPEPDIRTFDYHQPEGRTRDQPGVRSRTFEFLRTFDQSPEVQSRTFDHPQPEAQSRVINPLPVQPPSVKAGTYTPPHVRQALGLTSSSATKPGAPSFGVIGAQRRSEAPAHQRAFCVVCSTDEVTAVFLDCSHMCCCSSCAYVVSYCPVCHSKVRKVVEVKPVSSSAPPAAPLPSANLPFASNLLPSDLFQSISLSSSADSSSAGDGFLPDVAACGLLGGTPSSSSSSSNHLHHQGASSKYSFAQEQQVPAVHSGGNNLVARRPYRPPDVFR